MTQQQRFFKKILYIVIIAVLIVPLYMLGNPAKRDQDGNLVRGGTLARIRDKADLSEANLGEVDPASSTMKLATFGMRGVAIALLWNRSLEYEKRMDWNSVVATGNQIIMLEPHFISIWEFVGWKLAYNASAQFDDYRERYRWVIRGFDFQQRGTEYNKTNPRLFWKTGWTISQKIGIADEKSQYRRLFREDEEFHARQNFKERDNWLFGRNYYLTSEKLFDKGGDIGKETRMIFYSRSRMNLMHYAEWMEIDGCGINKTNTPVFDEEHAAAAWKTAGDYWRDFTNLDVVTTIEDKTNPGQYRKTSLKIFETANAEIEVKIKQIEAMLEKGQNRETILWDRWNKELTDEERAALLPRILEPHSADDYIFGEGDKPYRILREYLDGKKGEQPKWKNWREDLAKKRESLYDPSLLDIVQTPKMLRSETDNLKLHSTEMQIGEFEAHAMGLLNVTPKVLASMVQGEKQLEAHDICDEIDKLVEDARFSGMFRDILDYNRHSRRVEVEQQEEARLARDFRHQVSLRYRAAQHEESNDAFLKSMGYWKKLTEKPGFTDIPKMPQFHSDFTDEIEKYVLVLDQLERIFPEKFPFQDILRDDIMIKSFSKDLTEANTWLDKKMNEKKYELVRDNAETAMESARGFVTNNEVQALAPLPEVRDMIIKVARLYIEAWENIGGPSFEEAKTSGRFDNYGLKSFIELMINKGDADYKSLQTEEMAVVTEPAKALDHLEKAVKQWGILLKKYPIIKYDATSDFRRQMRQTAQSYSLELKKQNKEVPKDFPLKAFL